MSIVAMNAVTAMTMMDMKKEEVEWPTTLQGPKTNVTIGGNPDLIVEYYTKRLTNAKGDKKKYQLHGQCYWLNLDTSSWTQA